jgi:putative transposase
VTDAVLDEVRTWQNRPLDSVYPILYLDALQVKVKSQGRVTNKAIYLAFGVNLQGLKEVLGMWAAETEGARVLDAGHHGVEEPGRLGHLHRLR